MMNPLHIIYNITWATFAFDVVHANVQIWIWFILLLYYDLSF